MTRKDTYFKLAKGFYGRGKNCWSVLKPRVNKALQHAYVGRKEKKRINRRHWIQNINAACQQHGVKYSQFMYGLGLSGCYLNRKILADLAENEPLSFRAIVALSTEARKTLSDHTKLKTYVAPPPFEGYAPYPDFMTREADEKYMRSPQGIAMKQIQDLMKEYIHKFEEEEREMEKKFMEDLEKYKKTLPPGEEPPIIG